MSSRGSAIPVDAFDRPSSPSPSIRSTSSSSFSPFQPIVLSGSLNSRRPIVRRNPSETTTPRPFGEIRGVEGGGGVEDSELWETASASTRAGDDDEGYQPGNLFQPRLRDLRRPRPNVRRPETEEEQKERVAEVNELDSKKVTEPKDEVKIPSEEAVEQGDEVSKRVEGEDETKGVTETKGKSDSPPPGITAKPETRLEPERPKPAKP